MVILRHVVSLLLVGLMVGVVVSGAVSLGEVSAASTGNENDAYTQFWNILYREAWLVGKVNSSANSGHLNITATKDLISNSRAGENNAANISAQTWAAIQELKKSGVKLKYSAKDLKQMAEDIKKNGLPAGTVKELKSQGWTDDEINSLEEYIAKNAGNITTGFDMGSFLENFSTAFVRVGFKYVGYESWALEKWKWNHPKESTEQALKTYGKDPEKVVPSISSDWVSFYASYINDNVSGMKSAITSLVSGLNGILMPSVDSPGVTFVGHGGVILINVHRVGTSFSGYSYYWPSALRAYNLTRQIYVIIETMSLGNKNPQLQGLLDQKVAELKDALRVYYSDDTNPLPNPNPNPPKPCINCRCFVPVMSSNPTSSNEISGEVVNGEKESSLKEFALNTNSNYGYIEITEVDVVPIDVTTTYATYRVIVHFKAVDNVVNDIKVAFHGTGLSSIVDVGYLHPDDGVKIVSSVVSSKISGDGTASVSVAGTVTITGKTTPTPLPTVRRNESTVSTNEGVKDITATQDYRKDINLNSPINPSKVTFEVFTDPQSPVLVGSNVKFEIYAYNGNNKPITFNYRLNVQCPTSPGHSATKTITGSLSLANNSGKIITVFSNTFDGTGSYGYSGTLYFGQYSKTSQGTLDVRATSVKGSNITILGVSVSPNPAGEGRAVNFTVELKNNYNTKKSADVTAYLGDNLKQSKNVSIAAHATASLTLQLVPHNPGNYTWSVQVHTTNKGNSILEDSRMGELNVLSSDREFAVRLEATPTELKGGGTVYFSIKAWNFASDGLNIQFHLVNESGDVVYPKNGGWVSKFVPKGAGNYSLNAFSLGVHGIGMHKYTVIARISGEEEKSTATVEVEPTNGTKLEQVSAECSDLYFTWEVIDYHATLTCQAVLYNPTNESLIILNSSKGKPWIGTSDSGISMTPSSFNKHLSKFGTDVSNTKIPPQGDTVITFKSEISGVPLSFLEHYWGTYYMITIPYDVHLDNGKTPSFTLKGSGQITQNSYEVTADIGVNVFLFKGIAGDLEAVILLGESAKLGEVGRDAIAIGKEIVGWILWWKG